MLALPSLKLQGKITGLDEPQGECSDAAGNVWIANTQAQTVLEYSHAGKLVNDLTDRDGYPVACAIDATTGNLAVFNISDGSGAGEVLIFPSASGTPAAYQVPNFYNYYFGGYDTAGNLFVDGRDDDGAFRLGELPKGSGSGEDLTLSSRVRISFPGFVQWYARHNYLAVADQLCGGESTCIYWFSISNGKATGIGKLSLSNYDGTPVCDMVQGVIGPDHGLFVAGGDFEFCQYASSAANRWRYPAGGMPSNHLTGFDEPVGTAVSVK